MRKEWIMTARQPHHRSGGKCAAGTCPRRGWFLSVPCALMLALVLALGACAADRPVPAAAAAPVVGTTTAEARQPVGAATPPSGPVRLEELRPDSGQAERDRTRGQGVPGATTGPSIEAPSPWGIAPRGSRRP
jgi:hypothetical protein